MSLSVVAACLYVTGAANAAIIREDFDITNGWVQAMALSGNTLYIGGNFTQVGPATGPGVPIDASSGAPVSGYPKVSDGSKILAAVSDGSGGWFICGNFTAVGGASRPGIAHILANNTVSAWNPNPDGPVSVLAVSGSTVYAAGRFDRIGGQFSSRLAALDATTGLSKNWTPGPNGDVTVLSASGTTVYAGGTFSSIGGQPRSGIAALDASTSRATAWNPNANAAVSVLAVGAAAVYAAGAFTSIGGQSRNGIAALDAATGLATGWSPNPNGGVAALTVSGATVYAGGSFTTIGGQVRYRIAALDATTGFATGWHPDATIGSSSGIPSVTALAVSGNTVYAGGSFTLIGGRSRIDLAALDATTGLATAWDPNPNADPRFDPPAVSALAANGTAVYVGGSFTSIGGKSRNYIAAIDVISGHATAWNPDASYVVRALAVSGSTVYAGGTFDVIGGHSRRNIAALDATTGLATAWDPMVWLDYPFIPYVSSLAVSGNTVYAGGWFNIIGGQPRSDLAAIDAATGRVTSWNPNPNGIIGALAVSGATVYAGGSFSNIGGQTRSNIAALDATSGLANDWNPNSNSVVGALEVSAGTVYAGGGFTIIGGQPRIYVAALDAASGLATAWNANLGPNANRVVAALALGGETVFAGGSFTSAGGQTRTGLAALDAATGLVTDWNPNPNANGGIFALAAGDAGLYAGGYFTSMGSLPQHYLAAIATDVPTPTLLSLVSAQAEPEGIRLTWFAANGTGLTATVYRRTGASDWLAVGQTTADGTGKIIYEDADVSPGGRYGYRLGVVQRGQEEFLGEAWVEVPRAVGFALAGMRPNPAAQEYRVAFSLPDGGPARLELMDLAGRRVAARDVGTLGAGNHLVNLTQGQTLAPGVYLLRLTRGARSLTARAVVIR